MGGNDCVVCKEIGVGEVVGEKVVEDNNGSYCVATDGVNLF